jgi:hypothetical protein
VKAPSSSTSNAAAAADDDDDPAMSSLDRLDLFGCDYRITLDLVKRARILFVTNCANLSSMRKTFKSQRDREYVTMMHSLPRTTYMGERLSYANRRNSAIMKHLSTCQQLLMVCNKATTCSRILLIKTYGTTGYHNISRVC